MNTARIVVLAIAIGAGGIAAYLASGANDNPAPAPVAQMQTVDILVAKSDIGLGQSVKPDDLQWQIWPAATASSSFISRASKADAIKEITGSIARSPFIAGEPIREQKLVKADGSGFMAAILPAGHRAVSTAIDQAPKEKEGTSALVGRTVTLELKPEQTETLARARQSGTLSLALRSIADIKMVEQPDEQQSRKRGDNLNVIRYGVASQQTMQK